MRKVTFALMVQVEAPREADPDDVVEQFGADIRALLARDAEDEEGPRILSLQGNVYDETDARLGLLFALPEGATESAPGGETITHYTSLWRLYRLHVWSEEDEEEDK